MKVTIAITCYNYGRFLKEAIDSALAQTYPPHEILVVDDGSEDNSSEIARSYGPRIIFHARPHEGICAVRNFILHQAKGDAMVFLDADDRLHPDHLLTTVRAWENATAPKPAFVYTQRASLDHPDQISSFPDFDPASLKQKNYVLVSSLFLLPAIRSVGYDSAFHEGLEDFDLILGLLEKGYRGLRVNEPLLYVRLHGQTRSIACGQAEIRSRLLNRLLKKHHRLYSSAEARQFRKHTRECVLRKITSSPPKTTAERLQTLKLLIRYRAHPLRFIQLLHPTSPNS